MKKRQKKKKLKKIIFSFDWLNLMGTSHVTGPQSLIGAWAQSLESDWIQCWALSLSSQEDVLLKERVVQDTDAAEMAKNRWSWGETSYNIEELLRLDVPLQQALFRGLHLLHEPLDTSQCRAEAEEPVRSIISALQLQPNALKSWFFTFFPQFSMNFDLFFSTKNARISYEITTVLVLP